MLRTITLSPQEVNVTLEEVVHYHHFLPQHPIQVTDTEPRDGRSLAQIAHTVQAHPTAYAFHIEKRVKATVSIEGQLHHLVSRPTHFSRVYVGGTLYTYEELRTHHPEQGTLLENVAQSESTHCAIQTRAGNWLEFQDDDSYLEEGATDQETIPPGDFLPTVEQ